ncbi:uncharacterized protein [Cardiocondyla obscurior]|uniref:uncharacterized protein n=1 Tax=Cardiocondyla obscurior TaxID=286306 RepID=UPI0039657684
MEDWVDRCGWKGVTSFWTTQIITGHGCFSSYLHRIGKEASTACHHCDDGIDDAQHTLEVCPAWTEERQVLRTCWDRTYPCLPSSSLRCTRTTPGSLHGLLQRSNASQDRSREERERHPQPLHQEQHGRQSSRDWPTRPQPPS